MTIQRTYFCNLCRESDQDGRYIAGLYWLADKVELRQKNQCETHICAKCFNGIIQLEFPSFKKELE